MDAARVSQLNGRPAEEVPGWKRAQIEVGATDSLGRPYLVMRSKVPCRVQWGWQATMCPPPASYQGGGSLLQRGLASAQRGLK